MRYGMDIVFIGFIISRCFLKDAFITGVSAVTAGSAVLFGLHLRSLGMSPLVGMWRLIMMC